MSTTNTSASSSIQQRIKAAFDMADIDALHDIENELRGAPSSEHRAALCTLLINLSKLHSANGNYQSTLTVLREALEISEGNHNLQQTALACSLLATAYSVTGDYAAALHNNLHAMSIYSKLDDSHGLARITANIGKVYEATNDYQKALEHLNEAADLYKEFGSPSDIAFILGSIGSVYSNMGDNPTALEHFRQAYKMFEQEQDTQGQALAGVFMLSKLTQMGRQEEATALLERIDAMDYNNARFIIEREDSRAAVLELQDKLDEAYATLQEALTIATKHGIKSSVAEMHLRMREISKRRMDLDGYIKHNEAYLEISEEIRGAETQRKLAAETKDREIAHERKQRDRERAVLYSALPKPIADRVIRGEKVAGDHYDEASVLFLDIAGFTNIAARIPAGHVVFLLESIFSVCDKVCTDHGLTKVKTIGDSYMAVAGIPEHQEDHADRAAQTACDLLESLNELEIRLPKDIGDTSWVNDVGEINVRIGLHNGPVVAGVIGTERLQFDIWGDTVNVASRMESTGESGAIQVSDEFARALNQQNWVLENRGTIEIKGKGLLNTSWLRGKRTHS